ncbi:C40 family peptidase [Streptomyces sp. NPDC001054]
MKTGRLVLAALLLPPFVLLAVPILFVAAVAGGAAEHEDAIDADAVSAQAPSSVQGIPEVMLSAYTSAATRVRDVRPRCSGMRWSVVAGIGKVESNHAVGRSISTEGDITPRILGVRLNGSGAGGNTTSFTDTDHGALDGDTAYDRAVGPMQFLPSTWNGPTGQDGNDDGRKDPHNAFDAALGAAVYLCGTHTVDLSKPAELRKAIYRYNHSDSYVAEVSGHIRAYDALTGTATARAEAGGRAGRVIDLALGARGKPYMWGGGDQNGPTKGGFDCSGLMVYAFYQGAGITLPRTSQAMRHSGTKVSREEMQPGDIIVINNDGNWGHVGLYIGDDTLVHAPRPGKTVETTPLSQWTKDAWDIRRVL